MWIGSASALSGLAVIGPALVAIAVGCAREAERPVPTGLVEAAARGDTRLVADLLERGAHVDERDASGRTAVTAAVYAGSAPTVRVLVDAGANVNLQDDSRANAFLALGETGNVSVLDEVLRGDPDVALTNRFGGTALIPAAHRGHVEMVGALLARTEVDVDHVNDPGWTALLEAVILGDGGSAHTEIVRMLLEAGADPDIADRDGVTPLEHASRSGYDDIATLLTSR